MTTDPADGSFASFASSGRMVRFHSPVFGRFYLAADNVTLAAPRWDGFPVYFASEVSDLLAIHPALRALSGCADADTENALRLVHGAKLAL